MNYLGVKMVRVVSLQIFLQHFGSVEGRNTTQFLASFLELPAWTPLSFLLTQL